MSTTDAPCRPGQGRPARWYALAATCLLTVAMVVLPGLLVRTGVTGDGLCSVAFFTPFAAIPAHLGATASWQLAQRGRLLSARTLFGRRTVDLDRLTKVGHLEVTGRNGHSLDRLLLTDEHGVRLAVPAPRPGADDSVDQAIAQAVGRAPSGRVRVSRKAGERLWPEKARAHSCLGVLFRSLLWTVAVMVVGAVAMGVPLVLCLTLAGLV